MNIVIIVLLTASLLLFIASFFQQDQAKLLAKEVEQLSLKMLQEHYLMKRRLKVLEEELLLSGTSIPPIQEAEDPPNEILKNHVLALHNQGLKVEQISKQSSLSVSMIKQIIKTNQHEFGGWNR